METLFSIAALIFCSVVGFLFGAGAFFVSLICCIAIQCRLVSIAKKRQIEKEVENKFYEMMFKSKENR